MKLALQIFSWVFVVIGVLAIVGSFMVPTVYGFIGGALYLIQGSLALAYIDRS